MTIVQKLFTNLLFPLSLFSTTFTTDINLYSDKLYFDIFNTKWETIPSKEKMNRAIDFSSIALSEQKDNIVFGYKFKSEGSLRINKGFIETWYYALSDFETLSKKNDIGYYVDEPIIYGKLVYYQTDNLFLSKIYKNFTFTTNFIKGKQLQYMLVNGTNTKDRFQTDVNYFYTDQNFLTKNKDDDNFYTGYGLSFDIEFKLKKENILFNMGLYNLFGFINWQSISYLEYHFNSETKYIGDDGYYHYKPFGIGKYKIDSNFHQELPTFLKFSTIYNMNYFKIGNNSIYQNDAKFNKVFIILKHLKIGYLLETKDISYGIDTEKYKFEISQNIKNHTKSIQLFVKVKF